MIFSKKHVHIPKDARSSWNWRKKILKIASQQEIFYELDKIEIK